MKNTFNNLSTSVAYRLGHGVLASVLPTSVLVAMAIGLSSCGSNIIGGLEREPVNVKVALEYGGTIASNLETNPEGLGLVSYGTSLTAAVAECASGYSVASTALASSQPGTPATVKLYKGDHTCQVQLTGFTLGTQAYTSTGTGADISEWVTGDYAAGLVATFRGASDTDTIKVYIVAQVTSPVTTATVTYKYTDIATLSDSDLDSDAVSTTVPLTVLGQDAPNFTVAYVRYLSTNTNGSGNISFTLACGTAVTGTGDTRTCNTTNLTVIMKDQLDYRFLKTTANPNLRDGITVSEANVLFDTTPVAIASGELISAGGTDNHANTITNGGFYTSVLPTGAGAFYSSDAAEMEYVLIIRLRMPSTPGPQHTVSYLYVYVDIAQLTQS